MVPSNGAIYIYVVMVLCDTAAADVHSAHLPLQQVVHYSACDVAGGAVTHVGLRAVERLHVVHLLLPSLAPVSLVQLKRSLQQLQGGGSRS